jgi:rRNA pseudouridine-1189 N-methylase Emg1 (Nep1/Mra1 family)
MQVMFFYENRREQEFLLSLYEDDVKHLPRPDEIVVLSYHLEEKEFSVKQIKHNYLENRIYVIVGDISKGFMPATRN